MQLGVQATKMQGTIAAGDIGAVFAATPPLEMHAVDLQLGRELGSETELRFYIGGHLESILSLRDREEGVHPIA